MMLCLPLAGCDLWPFDEDRPHQRAKHKKSSLFERSPKSCPTACAMAGASKHELTLLFGSGEAPDKLAWGRPYVDGAGFKTFSTCIGKDDGDLDRANECHKRAHQACIEACVEAESVRINHKGGRHHARDQARKKARNKPPAKRDPQAP